MFKVKPNPSVQLQSGSTSVSPASISVYQAIIKSEMSRHLKAGASNKIGVAEG